MLANFSNYLWFNIERKQRIGDFVNYVKVGAYNMNREIEEYSTLLF